MYVKYFHVWHVIFPQEKQGQNHLEMLCSLKKQLSGILKTFCLQ